MASKGCVQLTSDDTLFVDRCFSGVKKNEEKMDERVDYCGLVNTRHKGFCLATLGKLLKDWSRGSYLVLKSTLRVPGDRTLMYIG